MNANDPSTTQAVDLDGARKVALRFAQEVRRSLGGRVRRVRLFGSAARGDWMPESDVDVLVLLSDKDTGAADEVSRLAFHVGAVSTGILVRPLIMSHGQFAHLLGRERRLASDIQSEGIEL